MLVAIVAWLLVREDSWVFIGSVPGLGLPQFHVANLLKHHGIESRIEGSITYGIQIAHGDRARALKILQQDALVRPFMYWRLEAADVLKKAKISSNLVFVNASLQDLAKVKALSRDPLLASLITSPIEWQRIKADDVSFVWAVSFKKFDYMNNAGKWEQAYFGKIIYISKHSGEDLSAYAWSWDKGKLASLSNSDVFRRRN